MCHYCSRHAAHVCYNIVDLWYRRARAASLQLQSIPSEVRCAALVSIAAALEGHEPDILEANRVDKEGCVADGGADALLKASGSVSECLLLAPIFVVFVCSDWIFLVISFGQWLLACAR